MSQSGPDDHPGKGSQGTNGQMEFAVKNHTILVLPENFMLAYFNQADGYTEAHISIFHIAFTVCTTYTVATVLSEEEPASTELEWK